MALFDQLESLADIEALIASGLRESETVEYKRAAQELKPAEHTEIAKDVSAFANSSGGLLIYGVATKKDDKTAPESIEPLTPKNIETVLQVISSNIRQPVLGIRHKTVERDGKPVCLLIDVPASPAAPHQVVGDYRYYRRQGPNSLPMPHDLVELYFGRRLSPELRVQSDLAPIGDEVRGSDYSGTFRLNFVIENAGRRAARHTLLLVTFPEPADFAFGTWRGGEGIIDGFSGAMRQFGRADNQGLIYPGLPNSFFHITFGVRKSRLESMVPILHADVHADEMRGKRGSLWIVRVRGSFEVREEWASIS